MTSHKMQHAISPLRREDFSEWYQQVIKAGDFAENSPVRGSMVIKPWGYALWEAIQQDIDAEIKRTGHVNAYFPLFIPISFLQKEAEHVEGFAKECAVVTHHRLELKEGKLVPSGELEEPLIVRPTSETIIGECYARWVESYRDLPLLINQWANVVRWEMRPRVFLRTTEFLWQEGHTVHATAEEALEEVLKMLEVYRVFIEDTLAIPLLVGEKSEGERFPGAEKTFTMEAMMQDKKALQTGTSHFLGQNFAKASQIKFTDKDGVLKYAFTTSWAITTRLIGGLIMVHGDDEGARLPPKISPKQVVIIPVVPKEEVQNEVFAYAEEVAKKLEALSFGGKPIRVQLDKREIRGGDKYWHWVKKGVPLIVEVGPKDSASRSAVFYRRDQKPKTKIFSSFDDLVHSLPHLLEEIQKNYFQQALQFRDSNLSDSINNFEEMRAFFEGDPKGFVRAKWCGDPQTEEMLKELQVTIRCIPLKQSGTKGKCVITGKEALLDAIFAKSY